MSMFCYQCEQTAKGLGCTVAGVCGKDAVASGLQDVLVYIAKGISIYAHRARQLGAVDAEIDNFVIELLFTTVTNVNFDSQNLAKMAVKASEIKDRAKKLYIDAYTKANGTAPAEVLAEPAIAVIPGTVEGLLTLSETAGITEGIRRLGEDAAGMVNLITYGLKGTAAYTDHAKVLGVTDDSLFGFFHEALSFLGEEKFELSDLVAMALKVGEYNLKAMELLDKANTGTYGTPVPTQVRVTPIKGKAIVVSGHDLKDLYQLLQQTEGKGINIYTHGEMLPCHGYPELKKFSHLAGNFGGAWQDQQKEFDQFPGAVLMTTNCIQKPKETYKGRIFTTGLVQFPGVAHIDAKADGTKDFAPVIEAALAAEGFIEDAPEQYITVGFGHGTVLGVADKVIDAVKKGEIKHFFLIGGCDGAKSGRNYYTEFAQKTPKDTVILTLACGKYRFNKLDFGTVAGLPRLLDMGQCNDAYSAIKVASALAEAFGVGVNELPLSLVLSWYEQKAVCILLTLLYLGIKNIRLGPSLPAFITPAVLKVLVDNYNIMPITTPDEDLKAILG